jgi:hypothetical protein
MPVSSRGLGMGAGPSRPAKYKKPPKGTKTVSVMKKRKKKK